MLRLSDLTPFVFCLFGGDAPPVHDVLHGREHDTAASIGVDVSDVGAVVVH